MYYLVKDLFRLMSKTQRKRFYGLQVLVILMAFAEIVGVASIAPFMAVVGDASLLEKDNILASVYNQSGLENAYDFLFWLGVMVLFLLGFASVFSMLTMWLLSKFAAEFGVEIADRLYSYYMKQPWLFHASGSTAQLTKQVTTESARVSGGIILPLMQMNAKLVLAVFIAIVIFVYDPVIALSGIAIFTLAYLLLYKTVRQYIHQNGRTLSEVATLRFRLMNEGFGGIKDVLLLGRNSDFISRFSKAGKVHARSEAVNYTLTYIPRYLMELIAFGAILGLLLYLIVNFEGDLGQVLPVLSVYALAGLKLLPAFQQVYGSVAQIKANTAAYESIRKDLESTIGLCDGDISQQTNDVIIPKEIIQIENVTFTYPSREKASLHEITLDFPVNKVIGIVGPSGSGKSTVIDVLLGLIPPGKGRLLVDGKEIDSSNCRAWQNTIGFVPQSIFLSEGSIAENVAFGIAADLIERERVENAIRMARLEELIVSFPLGIDTTVGERGVQLSGGQRQRIGIARALYHSSEVLVFDEATSALDGITEKMIMEAIHDFSGKKTIVMIAHRLKTVKKCDLIYFIDQGRLVDKGTYDSLLESNPVFKNMAEHA